ncbi:MAG: co-chaperone GroES [Armatimonadota bacterium]|nr:co-chaperone GroES [Armatimonadota bacterium]
MIKPLGDRVVIEPSESEETTSGGIVLPDAAKKKPQEGTVIAVGPGRILDSGKRSEIGVEIGALVVYAKYGGTEIKVDNKDYVILEADQIYAIKE